MDPIILRAYKKIHDDHQPMADTEDWVLASNILDEWNVPVLGEDLAKETLFRIINHVKYPNLTLTREIVGSAEDKISELFPEIGEADPHMALVENLERAYYEEKTKKEVLSPESKRELK